MSTKSGSKEGKKWPPVNFRFEVDLGIPGASPVIFKEVSGMDKETEIVEYRHNNNSKIFTSIEMPGVVKLGNVTMKYALLKKDASITNWISQISMNSVTKVTMTIKLLNEQGKSTMQWTLKEAWPTKISFGDQKSDSTENLVDILEISYQYLTVLNI